MGAINFKGELISADDIIVNRNSTHRTISLRVKDKGSLDLSYEESSILFKKLLDELRGALYEEYLC